jgi:hypothetical protein
MNRQEKQRAPRNRTLTLSKRERAGLSKRLLHPLLPQLPKALVGLLNLADVTIRFALSHVP